MNVSGREGFSAVTGLRERPVDCPDFIRDDREGPEEPLAVSRRTRVTNGAGSEEL